MSETKVCVKCGIEKPITEFWFNKSNNYFRTECKHCGYSLMREYRYKNNPALREKVLDRERKKREKENKPSRITRVCRILRQHHEELKDDPDHLSCDFLKEIIGVDCK